MKHENNFDFLRFLFSFLVVVGHLILLSGIPEFRNEFFAAMPNYSVFAFFVISGYLVWGSYERLQNLKKYSKNRAKRILPAYFAVVIFFAFFLYFFASDRGNYFSVQWLKYLAANLTFANFLQPCINYVFTENLFCAVNGSLWTIKIELMFYITVPILFYLSRNFQKKAKNLLLISLYLASVAYYYTVLHFEQYVLVKQLPGCFTYFASGILLFLNKDYFRININYFVIPALIIVLLEKMVIHQTILFPFALGVLIFWFAHLKIGLKNFGKYGDFSYGMYLIHFPVIQIFIVLEVFEKYSFLGFFVCVLVVVGLSVLSWNFVEKPFLKKRPQS